MNFSSHDSILPESELAYFRERTKNRVHGLIISHFAMKAKDAGLRKQDLANKLRKNKAQISRWFAGPSNWTLDTVSDLLLAMGAELEASIKSIEAQKAADEVTPLRSISSPTSTNTGDALEVDVSWGRV